MRVSQLSAHRSTHVVLAHMCLNRVCAEARSFQTRAVEALPFCLMHAEAHTSVQGEANLWA